MFTLEQIRLAHTQVKTGADFPAYIQEMKKLGVLLYEHFVNDGHIIYYGPSGFKRSAPSKWTPVMIAPAVQRATLQYELKIHQEGQTNYLTFCRRAAETGIEKWIVDMQNMMCTYYDKAGGEIIRERIPETNTYSD